MENLNFGWEFGIMMIFILGILYYLIAAGNYLLVVFLGEQLKKLIDKRFPEENKNIYYTALPFLFSAIIIYFTIIKLSLLRIDNFPAGTLFLEPFSFYFTGRIGYTLGVTCVSLTRYSYTNDLIVTGRLKKKRTLRNFLLWTTMSLVLTIICKNILGLVLPVWLTYAPLIVWTTYLFLKRRNINQPPTD